ncbi:MAG: Holliday junction resolvase RuvX [Cyclobacteriaceae bacterium]
MGRLLSIDYGLKRTGIAVSDPLKIIATALDTIPSETLISFLENYFKKETVDMIILGMPRRLNNAPSEMALEVEKLIVLLKEKFPQLPLQTFGERHTSIAAQEAMIRGGMKKKDRREKSNIDKISAVLILQEFMSTARL